MLLTSDELAFLNDGPALIISNQTKYFTARKVHLNNTLIHSKAKEMNCSTQNSFACSCCYTYILLQQGQPNGLRYTLVKLCEMVAQDPQMQDLTKDQKATYMAALSQHREQKVSSMQANNMATARDILVTTERVVKEVSSLPVTCILLNLFSL
jgi:hypothetical protein